MAIHFLHEQLSQKHDWQDFFCYEREVAWGMLCGSKWLKRRNTILQNGVGVCNSEAQDVM